MHDSRLLGTWKSDNRRTFRHIQLRLTDKRKNSLRKLLGKMIVRYTRKRVYFELDGNTWFNQYTVIGKDSSSVAILVHDHELYGEDRVVHIVFGRNCYYVPCLLEFNEYFRKVG